MLLHEMFRDNKPIAYIGLFLVLAGFLSVIGLFAFGESVEWLRDSREGAAWGAFAMCIVGCAFGLINWRTAPGKVAACFGGVLVVLFVVVLLMTFSRPSMADNDAEPTRHREVAVTNTAPLELGSSIPLAVQSPGVAWKGNTYHLVNLGSVRFDLDQSDCLKADIQAGLTMFDNVDYDISGAVFDAAGQMLGSARAQCKVERLWLGGVKRTGRTIRLDFGVSLDYRRAAAFVVSVSNRKVLTPDDWQK
jgi:drug/metabolite transporter superfamily protein YnfA